MIQTKQNGRRKLEMSPKSTLNGFLRQMMRSSVNEITSCVHTKRTILFNLGE